MDIRSFTFGAAAGIKKDIETETAALVVRPGDVVCLCTDGLTETKKANGDLFGADAIGEIVRRNYFLSAKELANKILRSVEETAEQGINTDDRTVQILKIE
jgi:sigma-B regulation protein RsbU (phosphoserine phosphatase)